MLNGEILVSSASSGAKLKSGFKNLSSTLLSKIKASKDEFTFSKSKSKDITNSEPVASKDDQFHSRQASSKTETTVESSPTADKDDKFVVNKVQKDAEEKVDTASILSEPSESTVSSRSSSFKRDDTDSISLTGTKSQPSTAPTTPAISRTSTESSNSELKQPKFLARIRTAFSSQSSLQEMEEKSAAKAEKLNARNTEKFEMRAQKTRDAIDDRNTQLNATTEKIIQATEESKREALKLLSTEKIKPFAINKAMEKVQRKLPEKINVRPDIMDSGLSGLIAGKAEKEGMTPEAYMGRTTHSEKIIATKAAASVAGSGIKLGLAQSALTKNAAKLKKAEAKLAVKPESDVHPDDLIMDTAKQKGRLLAQRRIEVPPTQLEKEDLQNPDLSRSERTEKWQAANERRIDKLENQVSEYDAAPLHAALKERDAFQVGAVVDGVKGVGKNCQAAGDVARGHLENHLPYALQVPDDELVAAENALTYNVSKEVAKGGNAEKMLSSQWQVENLHQEIGPAARELKALKTDRNLARERNAHVDEDGDVFYDPYEHGYELRVDVDKQSLNLIPSDLEESRIDMLPKGLGELRTRALPELGRRFKEQLRATVENFKPSNRMPGEFVDE